MIFGPYLINMGEKYKGAVLFSHYCTAISIDAYCELLYKRSTRFVNQYIDCNLLLSCNGDLELSNVLSRITRYREYFTSI